MSEAKRIKLAPSLLSADFARLKQEIDIVAEAGADWLHLDVMDGHFVPNITIGPCVVEAVKKVSPLPLDVHLMIRSPEKYWDDFIHAGSDWLTFHLEATEKPLALVERAKKSDVRAGIAIKPGTDVENLSEFLDVDLILIMSVEPGFGGQKFMPQVLSKIEWIKKHSSRPLVSIDGGINAHTASLAVKAGVDVLVAGSAIFKASSPAEMIKCLKNTDYD